MTDGKQRPGGLTALAVLNFIFGGLNGLVGIGALLLALGASTLSHAAANADMKEHHGENAAADQLLKSGGDFLAILALVVAVLYLLNAFLLIASGVGYIGMKKYGRVLGTIYALLSLGASGLGIFVVWKQTGQMDISLTTIAFSIYPVLTLILVNTSFKDDLVN
jgi:hypothetical protein